MMRLLLILLLAAQCQGQTIKIFNFAGTAPVGGGGSPCNSPPFYEDFTVLTQDYLDYQSGWDVGAVNCFYVVNGEGVYATEPSWTLGKGATDTTNCELTDRDKQWVSFIYGDEDAPGSGGGSSMGAMLRGNAAMDTLQWINYDMSNGGWYYGTRKGTTWTQWGWFTGTIQPGDSITIKCDDDTIWVLLEGTELGKDWGYSHLTSGTCKYIGLVAIGDEAGFYIRRWRGGNW